MALDARLARRVEARAAGRCDYCRLPRAATSVPFEVDHVIARKHGGRTVAGTQASMSQDAGIIEYLNILKVAAGRQRALHEPQIFLDRSPASRITLNFIANLSWVVSYAD